MIKIGDLFSCKRAKDSNFPPNSADIALGKIRYELASNEFTYSGSESFFSIGKMGIIMSELIYVKASEIYIHEVLIDDTIGWLYVGELEIIENV